MNDRRYWSDEERLEMYAAIIEEFRDSNKKDGARLRLRRRLTMDLGYTATQVDEEERRLVNEK